MKYWIALLLTRELVALIAGVTAALFAWAWSRPVSAGPRRRVLDLPVPKQLLPHHVADAALHEAA